MNSTNNSKYTGMYNTFKTYCHGKDINSFYGSEINQDKEKSKTEQNFNQNNINNYDDYNKTDMNINKGSNVLFNSSDSNNNYNSKYEINKGGVMPQITEDDRENEGTFYNENQKFDDEYDEQYVNYIFIKKYLIFQRNIICWNCKTAFAGGKTWEKVTCPKCKEVNEVPLDENDKVGEWERFLEMRHIKVTCPNCKKNIYCTRESEHVTCSECHCIMTIIKEVPLRPGTYEHKFTASIAVPNENQGNKNNKNKYGNYNYGGNKTQKKMGGYQKFDPFQDLLEVSKKNENNIKKYLNK